MLARMRAEPAADQRLPVSSRSFSERTFMMPMPHMTIGAPPPSSMSSSLDPHPAPMCRTSSPKATPNGTAGALAAGAPTAGAATAGGETGVG